ncbi:helix-turn-helix domain-containing protein, partial [Vibrio parahaemolyticus]|uniref:helix-turn-helix domain-containing protein n=1 Tax=Vibrio parahaemolyticus TaxID=670 RepID=UPI0029055F6C
KEAKKLNVKKSTSIASKYNISTSTMRDIVIRYELFGPSGLIDKHNKHVYAPELKLKIVLYKIKTNKTYYEVAKKFKITNHSIVAN